MTIEYIKDIEDDKRRKVRVVVVQTSAGRYYFERWSTEPDWRIYRTDHGGREIYIGRSASKLNASPEEILAQLKKDSKHAN